MTIPFRPRWYFFVALVSITFIGPLSLHLFIPAMPAVKEAFGVSTGMAQLTMSLAMLSMAFFTVAYGGLSDRFGRKRVLLGGLVLFTCGAAACMVAANMPMLLAGRILQGAGAGCGVVLARAIARDVYGQDRVAQVIAYLTAAYVLGPMVAPPIGGQLTVLFGWRALFVLASAVGLVVILAVTFGVPETRTRSAGAPRGVFAGYKSLLRRPRFVGFMLQPGMMSAAFFTQATAASFLATDNLGADAAKIGLWFFAFPIGFMTGVSSRFAAQRSIEFMTILGGVTASHNGVDCRLALFRRHFHGRAYIPECCQPRQGLTAHAEPGAIPRDELVSRRGGVRSPRGGARHDRSPRRRHLAAHLRLQTPPAAARDRAPPCRRTAVREQQPFKHSRPDGPSNYERSFYKSAAREKSFLDPSHLVRDDTPGVSLGALAPWREQLLTQVIS